MPQYQHDIHFSLDEARELVPWLREKLGRLSRLFDELVARGFDPLKGAWTGKGNGHPEGRQPDEFDELIELVGELDQRGLLVKDLAQGIVDFPHIRPDGEEVYLCWMLQEPTIAYWHRIAEGLLGRIPIEEQGSEDSSR